MSLMKSGNVTISLEEYQDLLDSRMWEQALECAGVDNWEGYDYATTIYQEMKEEGNID